MNMPDNERELCEDCPYCDDDGYCQSPIGCLNEGIEPMDYVAPEELKDEHIITLP